MIYSMIVQAGERARMRGYFLCSLSRMMMPPSLDTPSWYSVLPSGGTADVVSGIARIFNAIKMNEQPIHLHARISIVNASSEIVSVFIGGSNLNYNMFVAGLQVNKNHVNVKKTT